MRYWRIKQSQVPVSLSTPQGWLPIILRPSNAPLSLTKFVDEAFVEMAERSPDFVKAIARGEIEEFFHQTHTVTPVPVPPAPAWRGPNGEVDEDGNEVPSDYVAPPVSMRGPNGEDLRPTHVQQAAATINKRVANAFATRRTEPVTKLAPLAEPSFAPTPEQEAAVLAILAKADLPIDEPPIDWLPTTTASDGELPIGRPDQTWDLEQIVVYMRNNGIAAPNRITKPALLRAIANASVQAVPTVITPVVVSTDASEPVKE